MESEANSSQQVVENAATSLLKDGKKVDVPALKDHFGLDMRTEELPPEILRESRRAVKMNSQVN